MDDSLGATVCRRHRSIFSPDASELKFRISSYLASYLNSPGEERLIKAKKIRKLYDARSAVAHGREKNDLDALKETYELSKSVVINIINERHVPTQAELEVLLFNNTLN